MARYVEITPKANITSGECKGLASVYKLFRELTFLFFISLFVFFRAVWVGKLICVALCGTLMRSISSCVSGFDGCWIFFSVAHDRTPIEFDIAGKIEW